jgi:hypothetical protein
MKRHSQRLRCGPGISGHTLPEAVIAVALVGMMVVSLYAGFSAGFTVVRAGRENMRATQILVQRTELFRLYSWNELIHSNDFNNVTFVESHDPLSAISSEDGGTVYSGTILVETPEDMPAGYRDDVRLLTVSVFWTNTMSGSAATHSRQMQTVVARYGIGHRENNP